MEEDEDGFKYQAAERRKRRQIARKGAEGIMINDLGERRPAEKRTGESQEGGEQQPPRKTQDVSKEQEQPPTPSKKSEVEQQT